MAKKLYGAEAQAYFERTKNKKRKKEKGVTKNYGRNKIKCERYRRLIGKPNGPGAPGNKRGKNHH